MGVDANNFFPVSSKQIVSFFEVCRKSDDYFISKNLINMMDAAISNLKDGHMSDRIL